MTDIPTCLKHRSLWGPHFILAWLLYSQPRSTACILLATECQFQIILLSYQPKFLSSWFYTTPFVPFPILFITIFFLILHIHLGFWYQAVFLSNPTTAKISRPSWMTHQLLHSHSSVVYSMLMASLQSTSATYVAMTFWSCLHLELTDTPGFSHPNLFLSKHTLLFCQSSPVSVNLLSYWHHDDL